MTEPFVDIHCHLLPELDDGAASLDEALAMAEMAVGDGTGTIVATPHQLGNHADNSASAILAATERLQSTIDRRGLRLRVLSGADVRIEPDLVGKIRRGEVMTLANHRRHVLLELPHEVYFPLDGLLAELNAAGLVGILSHPERNVALMKQPGTLRPLVERGCLMQVTAGSLTGLFGSRVEQFAVWLVEQGLVHFVASDAHGTRNRTPGLSEAFGRVAKLAGQETALDCFCRHPSRVAAGQDVRHRARGSLPARRGWFGRNFVSGLLGTRTI
ncbi:MAG: CpsB/CapC family capsule biosynthesis tyrosine phosphatase [Thermoguttaceae bacterium]